MLDMHDIQIFHSDSSTILPILTVVLLTNKTRIYRDFLDLVVPGQSHRTVRVWPSRLVPGSICEDNKREPNRLCPCSYLLKFLFPAFSVAQFKHKQYFKPKPVFSTLCSCFHCFPLLFTRGLYLVTTGYIKRGTTCLYRLQMNFREGQLPGFCVNKYILQYMGQYLCINGTIHAFSWNLGCTQLQGEIII